MTPARTRRVHVGFVLLALVLGGATTLGVPALASGAVMVSSLLPAAMLVTQLLRGAIAVPMPWRFVTAGLLLLTLHNALAFVADVGGPDLTVPYTLPLGYVGLLVGALLLTLRYTRYDLGGIVDAVLIALSAASLVWALVLDPHLAAIAASDGERLYDLVVVLLVSGIAGAIVRAALTSPAARTALVYMLVAVGMTLAGNVVTILTTDPVTQEYALWIGTLWVTGYLALGAAATHPSIALFSTPQRRVTNRLSRARLAFLGVVLGLNPALVAVTQLVGDQGDTSLLVLGSFLVVPLVMLRFAQIARLHSEAERALADLATQDQLTGLPNRRGLDEALEAALADVEAGRSPGLVVLFLDLDDFKCVNDEHGHSTGDALLVTVAARLRHALRPVDVVGRFGGDEFVVLLPGDPDVVGPTAVRRVEAVLAEPVRLEQLVVRSGASVGSAAVHPGDGVTAEQLLSRADARMYERKRARRASRPAEGPTTDVTP